MGPKRKKPRKSKGNQFNKNKRNSYNLKLRFSNSVLSADCSSCKSDLDSFANVDNKESISKGFNQELRNLNSPANTVASPSTCVTSTKKRESVFTQIEGASESLVAKQKYEFTYGKINITELVANLSTDDDAIPSKDDELCYLNDFIIDSRSQGDTDSTIVYTRDELETSNDGILGSLSKGSTNTSESTAIFTRDKLKSLKNVIDSLGQGSSEIKIVDKTRYLKSPVCRTNNPSPSFSVERIEHLQRRVLKRNDKLTCLPINSDSGTTFLNAEPSHMEYSSSSDFDSGSFKEEPSNASSIIPSNYKETFLLLKSRKEELKEKFNQEVKDHLDMGYCFERLAKYIINPENLNFTKSKRNACIQNMYKKKLEEGIEYRQEILSQFNNILKIFQENYEIQLRKLEEIFEKFGTFGSDNEIGFVDKNWKCFVENTINNFRRMDDIKFKRKTDIHGLMRRNLMKLLTLSNFFEP